ncbi:hypothetical protein VNO80_06880 [Phaseolus coccineus]|uniref:cytokinin riboside 5'-monophosphate phosphoribohydrolase n=1 Tax=Phaseolus coccineus TaxID=3886 RepID=A0AAN9NI92_PHACN
MGLLNVDGYYNSLLSFMDNAVDEGFITPAARHIIVSAQTAQDLMSKLEAIAHSPHTYYANRSCNEGEGSSYTNNDPQTSKNIILAVGESGGLLRSERRPEDIVEVEAIVEDGFKTPATFLRLRDLWELGEVTARPRWRSNGGLGSIHYGTNSDSRLSRLSHVESDKDII